MQDPTITRIVLDHSRREALLVGIVWLLTLVWVVGYCYLHGYQHAPDSWLVEQRWARSPEVPVRISAGIPDWVIWGIMLPGGVCGLITLLFGTTIVRNDDLGSEAEGKQ